MVPTHSLKPVMHACMHSWTHASMLAYIYRYIDRYIDACMRAHMHTHLKPTILPQLYVGHKYPPYHLKSRYLQQYVVEHYSMPCSLKCCVFQKIWNYNIVNFQSCFEYKSTYEKYFLTKLFYNPIHTYWVFWCILLC